MNEPFPGEATFLIMAFPTPKMCSSEDKLKMSAAVKVSNSCMDFSIRLYEACSEKNLGKDIFFSPFNVFSALGMTLVGARHNTASQMKVTLGFGELDEKDIHDGFHEMITHLSKASKSGDLYVANRLYLQNDFSVLPTYSNALEEKYGSSCASVDFVNNPGEAAASINRWVAEMTKGKIQDLIQESAVNHLTRIIITCAIYFKKTWTYKFSRFNTSKAPFYISKDNSIEVELMFEGNKEFGFAGSKELGCKALELLYADGLTRMLILLPDEIDGIEKVEKALTPKALSDLLAKLNRQSVQVWLPKFKLENMFSLSKILFQMGMEDLFLSGQADLSGITGCSDLFVDDVVHKTFIEVNEEGTEAAAATAVSIQLTSAFFAEKPEVFRADHPFLFLIIEKTYNTVLFMGALKSPSPA
ncbi:leukocyte elastase inhibitor A-like isoform X1 [Limulus polyphemus]|uniref:Leukocyte elastase inhibitor A-like isoform X1 n=2 Tax=Limulus polyphemus TaxID=6850 RepID=A0ABM1SN24_LIMPO|nr:leukocyte elastase inhibitor A-like isoform X1 [Limulus polyphemus]